MGKFFDPPPPRRSAGTEDGRRCGQEAGIWIGICGELGADLSMLQTFLAIGIDELSVTPTAVLPLRATLRKSIAANCGLKLLES